MARLPVLMEDDLTDDNLAEVEAGERPRAVKGPTVRVGAASAPKRSHHKKSTVGGGKTVSRASQTRTGAVKPASRKRSAAADPLTEWAGEGLAALLQLASLRLGGGKLAMQRAEALGVTKPATRLLRRNLLPATIIDIDMPDEDKRDISLLLVTLGRYVGRILDRRMRPSAQQQAELAQRMRAAEAAAEHMAESAGDAVAELGGVGGLDALGDISDADMGAFLARIADAQAAAGSGGGAGPAVNAPVGGGPAGADPNGFARLIASGVLPGFTGNDGE